MTLFDNVRKFLAVTGRTVDMGKYGIITCPVCGQRYVRSGVEATDRTTLKELARTHLKTHRLDESKRGIYGVLMVEQMERVGAIEDEIAT
ncbi:hypothetical protein [Haladaptatus sp. ZSTT2]|uniref:hypothetical protein n=1 Tax=Haladaptatus sp. ZSTT2 TaxID=3120515 RepID=UPI00300F19E7